MCPLRVRPISLTGDFQLIEGRERFAIWARAGKCNLPAVLADDPFAQPGWMHRVEMALVADSWRKDPGESLAQIAEKLQCTAELVSEILPIAALPPRMQHEMRQVLTDPQFEEPDIVEILQCRHPEKQDALWEVYLNTVNSAWRSASRKFYLGLRWSPPKFRRAIEQIPIIDRGACDLRTRYDLPEP